MYSHEPAHTALHEDHEHCPKCSGAAGKRWRDPLLTGLGITLAGALSLVAYPIAALALAGACADAPSAGPLAALGALTAAHVGLGHGLASALARHSRSQRTFAAFLVAAGPGGVAAVLWQAGMRAPVAAILLGAAAPWLASRLWRRTAAS